MKRSLTLLFAICIGFLNAYSQANISIKEETKGMSKGMQNGFSVAVPQYKKSDLQREWVKFMRKKTKSKTLNTSTEWSMLKGKVDVLSFDTLSLYTGFSETNAGIVTSAFVSIKDSFITSANYPIVAEKVKNLLFDFAKTAYIKVVEKELASEKRTLEQLKDDQERLLKNEDKVLETITESTHKIEENETELDASKDELEIKQKDIFNQKQRALSMSRKGEERKEQNEIVREMERDKKSHLKHQQNLTKENSSLTTTVRAKERMIETLKLEQARKTADIKKQEEKIKEIEKKQQQILISVIGN